MIAALAALHPAVLGTAVFILGLLVGSFLNVVILRFPPRLMHEWRSQCRELLKLESGNDENPRPPGLVSERSACPGCGHTIACHDNIPVLSWLILKRRCRHCQKPISWRYPLVELLNVALTLSVFLVFGPGSQAVADILLTCTMYAAFGCYISHQW